MISGRDALTRVERAIAEARGAEGKLDAVLKSATDEAQRLRAQLAGGYRTLALIRLDLLQRDQVVGELDASERRAKELIAAHKQALDALAARRAAQGQAVEKAAAARNAAGERYEAAVDALDDMRAKVEAALSSDAEWTAQKARCDAAADIARGADEKADVAETDLAAKRKPYEADALFTYLWSRGFETRAYAASPLVKFLDARVARLVGYTTARPNYAMLLEIPLRLREHAKAREAEFEAEKDKIEAIERKALLAAGAGLLEQQAASAKTALDAAAAALADAEQALAKLDAEHAALVSSGNETAHKDAVDVLSQAIAREDVQTLYQEAFATQTPQDEQVVRTIEQALAAIAKADKEVADIRAQALEAARRRTELEGVRDNVRRKGYDDPFGSFEFRKDDILAEMIGGILRGALRGGDLWREMEGGYRRRSSRSTGGFGGSFPFPTTVPGGRGGGSGSGGFKTGGGIRFGGRHGGFKTGGRF